MHTTFTSGAARRRELDPLPVGGGALIIDYGNGYEIRGSSAEERAAIDAVNAKHDALGRINPILDLLRDEWDAHEAHAIAVEYLFQLARHWAAWQDASMGTFPLDYRDMSGPASREEAEGGGEDRVYWGITDLFIEELERRGATVRRHPDLPDGWEWDGSGREGNRIQGYIVHATAVLTRIYEATKDDA